MGKLKVKEIEDHIRNRECGVYTDEEGGRGEGKLVLKITPRKKGVSVEWYFRWFAKGKGSMLKLGRYAMNEREKHNSKVAALTLPEARVKRVELADIVRQGLDPKIEKARSRALEEKRRVQEDLELAREKKQQVTLAEYWPVYAETAMRQKQARSFDKEHSHFRKWLKPHLGSVPLKLIDLDSWEYLLKILTRGGLSPRTRQYVCLTLRMVLNHAFTRKIIPTAPPSAKLVGATHNSEAVRRTRVLTDRELRDILGLIKDNNIGDYQYTLFCALTGCRASEAFRLKWASVDLGQRSVAFHQTKNGESRSLHLSDTLLNILEEIGPKAPSEHVFLNRYGRPFKEAPKAFRTAVKALGLNEGREELDRVVFHTLRHTAATRMGKMNIPLRDLMDVGGWKTAAMALRYQHSSDEVKARAMSALESMVEAPRDNVLQFPVANGN